MFLPPLESMEKKFIDYHTHTIYSDGTDSPKTLVRNAKIIGLDSLAITDHDTTASYEEASQEARRWNLELASGVEVTTQKYHILGLGIDVKNEKLQEFLAESRWMQLENTHKRVDALQAIGVPINFVQVRARFSKSRLGKYNVVMYMASDRACEEYFIARFGKPLTHTEIFYKYFGKDGLARVEGTSRNSVEEAETIRQIHRAGGLAIIAHPFKEVEDMSELDVLVKHGIDGLEVQPNYAEKNAPFVEYAQAKNLIMTYGSDYHGICFPHRKLLGRGENLSVGLPLIKFQGVLV